MNVTLPITIKRLIRPRYCLQALRLAACWLILSVLATGAASAQSYALHADDWASPRSGRSVAAFDALQGVVNEWLQSTSSYAIEIRYPGGESGSLWASELHDWLVALGIPSQYISTQPGSPSADELMLEVVPLRTDQRGFRQLPD